MNARRAAGFALLVLLGCGGGGGKTDTDSSREAASTPGGGAGPPTGLSFLFLSIDTCRPDHIGCYGHEAIETPRIDGIGAAGARFARAMSSAPLTLPSHTSMLTADFPYRHRVRNNGTYRLPDEKTTLAEWLGERGYTTAAFVAAFVLDGRFGLRQGFQTYNDSLPPERETPLQRGISELRGDAVIDRAIRWLEKRPKNPFFLFVHLFDPHQPYEPPEPYATRYADAPYDGEIAFVDEQIGRLLDALDRLGLADETIVCVIGDHGQGLGDHGEVTHAVFTYDATVRVPLLLRWPDHPALAGAGLQRGVVVESLVRTVDVAPTAIELLGLPPMPAVEGTSLVPLLRDPAAPLRLVNYAESMPSREDFGWSEVRSLTTEEWKYILLPREELYDMRSDPRELENLASERPEVVRELRALLDEHVEEDRSREAESAAIDVDEETRRRLEALGYLAGEAAIDDNISYIDLPDPKDKIGVLAKYFGALALFDRREYAAGFDQLLQVEREDPGSPRIVGSIADTYLALGDVVRAESVYTKAIELGAGTIPILSNHAYTLYKIGRVDEAVESFRAILDADPEAARVHARLGEIHLAGGRYDEAAIEFQKELEIDPGSGAAYVGLGKGAALQGRRAEAIKYYQQAITCPADAEKGFYSLGLLYEEAGDLANAVSYYRKAVQTNPSLVESYYNIAVLAKKQGDRANAARYLNDAVRVNPYFAKGHFGLGNLLREEGRIPEAIEKYRIAIECSRTDPDVYLNLGVAEASLGNLKGAIEAWELAARIAPDSPSAATAHDNIRAARAQLGGRS